jgi:hypothetical protein
MSSLKSEKGQALWKTLSKRYPHVKANVIADAVIEAKCHGGHANNILRKNWGKPVPEDTSKVLPDGPFLPGVSGRVRHTQEQNASFRKSVRSREVMAQSLVRAPPKRSRIQVLLALPRIPNSLQKPVHRAVEEDVRAVCRQQGILELPILPPGEEEATAAPRDAPVSAPKGVVPRTGQSNPGIGWCPDNVVGDIASCPRGVDCGFRHEVPVDDTAHFERLTEQLLAKIDVDALFKGWHRRWEEALAGTNALQHCRTVELVVLKDGPHKAFDGMADLTYLLGWRLEELLGLAVKVNVVHSSTSDFLANKGRAVHWSDFYEGDYVGGCIVIDEKVCGVPDGVGTFRYSNGDRYDGRLVAGRKYGAGTYKLAGGGSMEGDFAWGQPEGAHSWQDRPDKGHSAATLKLYADNPNWVQKKLEKTERRYNVQFGHSAGTGVADEEERVHYNKRAYAKELRVTRRAQTDVTEQGVLANERAARAAAEQLAAEQLAERLAFKAKIAMKLAEIEDKKFNEELQRLENEKKKAAQDAIDRKEAAMEASITVG